ncbi:uncharacterized protein cd8b [Trichomycterus rosablanca]|uniref:uncharacterized protein cd8b n=1 Tax=Trichomycterus rosablanca TaxID=2290929 RepID=UPI002F35FE13
MILKYICSFLLLLTGVSAIKVLYPSINDVATLMCECPDSKCNRVFWYNVKSNNNPEFILSYNIANSKKYGDKINQTRFNPSYSGSAKAVFTLRITNVQEEDAGLYSCLLSSEDSAQDPKKLMPAGYYLRPGVEPPTEAPPKVKPVTKPKLVKPVCKSKSPTGCKALVLWTGVGVLLVLVVVLISTLYYFSRLPRKCRHRFAK